MKRLSTFIALLLVAVLLISCVASCVRYEFDDLGKEQGGELSNEASPSPDEIGDSENVPESGNIDFSKMTYIAYGDSITFGLYNSQRMESPYPSLVASTLGLKSCSNHAVNGGTLCSNDIGWFCMTDKILSITDQHDIVSVMLGVNDYNRNLPLGTITDMDNTTVYGSLNLIANHFDTYYQNSFVFFMTPYKERIGSGDCYRLNSQGYSLLDVANAIKEVAALHNYPVLDMFNYGRFELEYSSPESDGIHPSQEFIKNYTAPQIAAFIKENYK